MENYRVIIRILSILTLFITIGWYGNLSHIRETQTRLPNKYSMTFDEANSKLEKPIYRNKSYYYEKVQVETYSRTLIPFKYKKKSSEIKRQYYSN